MPRLGVARVVTLAGALAVVQAQADLDGATLTAPFAGTVAAVGVAAGEQAGSGTAVVTLEIPASSAWTWSSARPTWPESSQARRPR